MLTRRHLLARSGMMIATATLSRPSIVRSANEEITFMGYGGSYQDAQRLALFTPFEQITGIKVRDVAGDIDLRILKEIEEGGSTPWDLLTLPDRLQLQAGEEGLLLPLDFSIIDISEIEFNLFNNFWVGSVILAMKLTYIVGSPDQKIPQSWQDFWNVVSFPYSRGFYDRPTYSSEFALLADGVPKEQLYPLDRTRVFNSLERLRHYIDVFWRDFSQPAWLFTTKRITATPWTRSLRFKQSGILVEFTYNQAAFTAEGWCIPRNARNPIAAMKFINWALQPQHQAELTKYINFGPTNRNAFNFISDQTKANLPSSPDNFKLGFMLNSEYWSKNLIEMEKEWVKWRFS